MAPSARRISQESGGERLLWSCDGEPDLRKFFIYVIFKVIIEEVMLFTEAKGYFERFSAKDWKERKVGS